jgi:hypothetical protein
MKQRKSGFIIGFICCLALAAAHSYAAVTSTGEINVQGDDQGRVPASSTVTLIVTLVIDRSLAEPGEEIKVFDIILPGGFVVQPSNLRSVTRDGQRVGATAEVAGGSLRIVLDNAIADFSNSINEVIFDSRTPATTAREEEFRVRLRNLVDQPIGEFIKPGNADGKPNNNDFTLQVIPNVPPAPVQGFAVESDATGENDVTITWQRSDDPDVNGYFIYRDADPPINVADRSTNVFRDVNVSPGAHVYAIEAYKTPLLRSPRSGALNVVVSADTAPPRPPERLSVNSSGDGVRLTWTNSPSRDVVKFQVLFGASQSQVQPLADGEIPIDANRAEYEFIDRRPLRVGVFTYAVEAIDEVGNRSAPITRTLRILGEPFPNPFTPLSSNPEFNRVIFPARAIEGGEGEFSVLIFDINGVLVRELKAEPGVRELEWDGKDEAGEIVESGVYVYQIQLGESFKTGTVIVAK